MDLSQRLSLFYHFTTLSSNPSLVVFASFADKELVQKQIKNGSQSTVFQPIRNGTHWAAYAVFSNNYPWFMWVLNALLLKFVVIDLDLNNLDICQWAIFAIRNLLENNKENQKIVSSMDPRGLADSSRLRQFGVEAVELDNGKIKLVQITWSTREINILQMMITTK